NDVGIVLLERRRSHDRPGQDAAAKAGSKAFHLTFDGRDHIAGVAIGNVTVTPCRMLAGRGARGIEQAGLREQHKRTWRSLSLPGTSLGLADLIQRAAQMNCPGMGAFGGAPRDWPAERPIHFESRDPVTKPLQLATIRGPAWSWQSPVARHLHQLARSHIEK